jgi:A/G-specific adenine glycosylase
MYKSKSDFLVKNLMEWHTRYRRNFPWRVDPNPYKVLIAEIMLQRTRAEQVAKIYEDFLRKFPTAQDAARADMNEIAKLLEPLGLRHRIPRFFDLLRTLSSDYGGNVPHNFEQLVNLPGVGRYIASAVSCFGFNMKVPVVDANVVRVLGRFFGVSSSKKRAHTDDLFWNLAQELIQKSDCVKFNEALLDFAAIICIPRPRCNRCPLSSMCHFFNQRG